MTAMEVEVPPGLAAGDAMSVLLPDGSTFDVVVPAGCAAGSVILVEPPPPPAIEEDDEIPEELPSGVERMAVTVPEGVGAGDTFAVQATWGGIFEVTCPDGVRPGDAMEVDLPVEGGVEADVAGLSSPPAAAPASEAACSLAANAPEMVGPWLSEPPAVEGGFCSAPVLTLAPLGESSGSTSRLARVACPRLLEGWDACLPWPLFRWFVLDWFDKRGLSP